MPNDRDWVETWRRHGVHPQKSVMVNMIGKRLSCHLAGLVKCDAYTIKTLWIEICCKGKSG